MIYGSKGHTDHRVTKRRNDQHKRVEVLVLADPEKGLAEINDKFT